MVRIHGWEENGKMDRACEVELCLILSFIWIFVSELAYAWCTTIVIIFNYDVSFQMLTQCIDFHSLCLPKIPPKKHHFGSEKNLFSFDTCILKENPLKQDICGREKEIACSDGPLVLTWNWTWCDKEWPFQPAELWVEPQEPLWNKRNQLKKLGVPPFERTVAFMMGLAALTIIDWLSSVAFSQVHYNCQ